MVSGEDEARRDEPPFAFEDVWPEDEPFPLTDAECARLVRATRGYSSPWCHSTLVTTRRSPWPGSAPDSGSWRGTPAASWAVGPRAG